MSTTYHVDKLLQNCDLSITKKKKKHPTPVNFFPLVFSSHTLKNRLHN